jgi:hypothetical protein
MLDKMGMCSCNAAFVPMEPRLKLSKKRSGAAVDPMLYHNIVVGLRYLVHTRPNICYTVGYLSRFMEAPASDHSRAVKHFLCYIVGTKNLGCS